MFYLDKTKYFARSTHAKYKHVLVLASYPAAAGLAFSWSGALYKSCDTLKSLGKSAAWVCQNLVESLTGTYMHKQCK